MGWTYTTRPSGQSIRDFFAEEFRHGDDASVVDCASRLREAYIAYRTKRGAIIAIACLLEHKPFRGYNLGYKDMDEGMGPGICRCPARILDLLSPVEEYFEGQALEWARCWREWCRAWNAKMESARAVGAGTLVKFKAPIQFGDWGAFDTFKRLKDLRYPGRLFRDRFLEITQNVVVRLPGWREREFEIVKGG